MAASALPARYPLPPFGLACTAAVLLGMVAVLWSPALPPVAVLWLGLVGGAVTYLLWFRGLSRMAPTTAAPLTFLSPVTATAIGWAALGQSLTPPQLAGMAIVLAAVWTNSRAR